ncbi:hypothetical protein NUZ5A_20156 [Candidatus Nitrosotenuis uzonensis]|uniref:Uncharacterized protein n=2 Tax=Candidatus Nitrosotenuis uzonensis TaxID=1407055 RepID=A0A812EXI6_9ARCH|nr:hypothetical protein NUZ5A_20156 [Candidatus Nitrosotenuis uzonensis]
MRNVFSFKIKLNYFVMLFGLLMIFFIQPSVFASLDSERIQKFSDTSYQDLMTPKKQFDLGVAIDEIQCDDSLNLIIKSSDGSPACVTAMTKQKLIERGWATELLSTNFPPGSLRILKDPLSIIILGNNESPVIPIKRGETKNMEILITPKIPILESTVNVENYFGITCDAKNTTTYCPGKNITMNLSDTSITSQKKIALTIVVSNNASIGNYPYRIVTETTFNSPLYVNPITVGHSARFDLLVR